MKTVKRHRRITPSVIAKFKVLEAQEGSGTAAVRILEPDNVSPKDRAFHIARKSEQQSAVDFIDEQLQLIGVDAINKLGELILSPNEAISTKNVQYAIDHIRGQAVRREESKRVSISIESVLE